MTAFTQEQSAAIASEAKHVLVLAPAGSGKTTVYVERVLRLLKSGVDPLAIMCLTFTKRAAGEMRQRMIAALGDDDAAIATVRSITMGTVHSVCLGLIELYAPRLGFHDGVKINVLDDADAEMLLIDVAETLGIKNGDRWKDRLSLRQVKRALEAQYAGAKDTTKRKPQQAASLKRIINTFHAKCRELHALTFGLILTECRRLLAENTDVLETLQTRYTHVLVDECQDSSSVEYSLYETIGATASTFLVGDLRQSIYSFRHARPDMLKTWIADRSPAIYDLKRCFRCGDNIVAAANRLIAHNPDDPGEPMIGETGRRGKVEPYGGPREHVVGIIREQLLKDAGYAFREIAVIARKHSVLESIEGSLIQHGVPCYRVGAANAIAGTEAWLRLEAALRIVCDNNDRLAFMRLAKAWGLGRSERANIAHTAAAKRQSEFGMYYSNLFSFRYDASIGIIAKGHPASSDQNWLATLGIALCADLGAEAIEAADAMLRLWPKDGTVRDLLKAVRLAKNDTGEDFRGDNTVTLLTAHAAKGLEWPAVIIADCNQGVFPSAMSLREGGIEEERRTFYVAATRAKERLVIHYQTEADQLADERIFEVREPSQFIEECGQKAQREAAA